MACPHWNQSRFDTLGNPVLCPWHQGTGWQLESQGYSIVEAETGKQGLQQTALEQPDLVILDLGLPDIDGQQVLKELRAFSDVPVIVLSVRNSEKEKVVVLRSHS